MQDFGKSLDAKMDNLQKILSKETQDLKLKQAEMQNTITETKNSLEATTSRIQKAEEWISEEEQRLVQITDVEGNEKKDWVSSHCYTVEMNLSRNHEVVDLIPGLAQWVMGPALLRAVE